MDMAIYGAQGIALSAYAAMHTLFPARRIRCFLVTSREGNPDCLAGLPVWELGAFSGMVPDAEKENIEILIATPQGVMAQIEEGLAKAGFLCHVRLDSKRLGELMGYYYASRKEFLPLSALPVGYHKARLQVYMVKCHKDRPLTGDCVIPEWMIPIQAGAALCRERVADLLDCAGEHISGKNGNYSELTGLYWIWKNRTREEAQENGSLYYGLNHYRRIFLLEEDDLFRLADNEVDVVLPYPMLYEPNIEAHHARYLHKKDWDALLEALRELEPEYAEAFGQILREKRLYNYNMILARGQALDAYCSWLFPVLERVERLSEPKGDERSDRYIGYMGETLLTLFFRYNKFGFRIAHAGCRFLV